MSKLNDLIILASGAVAAWAFLIAVWTHKRHKKGKKGRLLPGLVIGALFAFALTIFLDALLNRIDDVSFYKLLKSGSLIPEGIFIVGALQGIVYEYVGSIALGQWYYPTVRHQRHLFLLLPIFWAVFMIIMQDTYAIFRVAGLNQTTSFILTAIIPFALIEGINLYTRSWVYERWLKSAPMLLGGWFILAYTFVIAFNHYLTKPLGY